jgi:putative ATPase
MAAPLADRMRPETLDEIVGQQHLLAPGKALRNIIESGHIPNLIFYGPPGVGKTTLARIISCKTDMRLHRLNGTTASTSDIKAVVDELDTLAAVNGVLLYLDEIQYFNKKQQQTLLEHIENGRITLIASTTENPYFYVYNALLSRSTVFEFKSVDASDIERVVKRAFEYLKKENSLNINIEPKVVSHIAGSCGGDVRKAINAAELCVLASQPDSDGIQHITLDTASQISQRSAIRYDREGDEHYDILSAFQKSMRGSDPDAAIHYLARLLSAGDLLSACRRLMVCACEDVGLAYPMIIPIVKSAVDMALQVGLPEARLALADAVILVSIAPKSSSGHDAINAAMADIESGLTGPIPRHLQNNHYDGEDAVRKGQFYLYPHDYPDHWTAQQYLPDKLRNRVYYKPGENKTEKAYKDYWDMIKGRKK